MYREKTISCGHALLRLSFFKSKICLQNGKIRSVCVCVYCKKKFPVFSKLSYSGVCRGVSLFELMLVPNAKIAFRSAKSRESQNQWS